jgi:hypothetical protein
MTKRPAGNVMPGGLREHGVVGQPGPPTPGNNYRIFPQELLGESTKAQPRGLDREAALAPHAAMSLKRSSPA